MDAGTWDIAGRTVAVFAGDVLGSDSIGTACWVWAKKQIFGLGGATLSLAGIVLLGLSIWHSVEFGISGEGVNFKAVADQVTTAAKSADEAAKEAEAASQAAQTAKSAAASGDKAKSLAAAEEAAIAAAASHSAALRAQSSAVAVQRALKLIH